MTAEVVEVSLVFPIAALPAKKPPLPAMLETSFSSVPIAETLSVPATDAVVPAPSWAKVETLEVAVATSAPTANKPLAATPVELAELIALDCSPQS